MGWHKEGRIFTPEKNSLSWMTSHASVPVADHLNGDVFRIYFSPRDREGRSNVSYFDIDLKNPNEILAISAVPLVLPGEAGTFDDAGAMTSWMVSKADEKWLYYIGWNLSQMVPFRNSLGLAISNNGGESFKKFSAGPILDRSIYDPAMVASCCILKEEDKFRMWYLSGLDWVKGEKGLMHRYHIKYAESVDGINWERTGIVCIDFRNQDEYAISRPSILKESGIYRMWYSYRGDAYKIGYAESVDGINWVRKDKEVGIETSSDGWDSEMIEYPFVFLHGEDKFMLYNGNGYGKTGIGLAVWRE